MWDVLCSFVPHSILCYCYNNTSVVRLRCKLNPTLYCKIAFWAIFEILLNYLYKVKYTGVRCVACYWYCSIMLVASYWITYITWLVLLKYWYLVVISSLIMLRLFCIISMWSVEHYTVVLEVESCYFSMLRSIFNN